MINRQATTVNQTVGSKSVFATKSSHWIAALLLPLVVGPIWCLAWRGQDGWLGTLSGFVLVAVLFTSAITDFGRQRIYNWATYSAFLWALAINIVATSISSGESTLNQAYQRATVGPDILGGIGLAQCLAGAAICFAITLAGYHLSGGGAGDVKLATVIGALLGVQQGAFAVAASYIVAAVAILAWTVYNNGPLALAKAGLRTLGSWLGPLWPFPPSASDTKLLMKPIPLGPYFAIGTLFVVLEFVPV